MNGKVEDRGKALAKAQKHKEHGVLTWHVMPGIANIKLEIYVCKNHSVIAERDC